MKFLFFWSSCFHVSIFEKWTIYQSAKVKKETFCRKIWSLTYFMELGRKIPKLRIIKYIWTNFINVTLNAPITILRITLNILILNFFCYSVKDPFWTVISVLTSYNLWLYSCCRRIKTSFQLSELKKSSWPTNLRNPYQEKKVSAGCSLICQVLKVCLFIFFWAINTQKLIENI